MWKYSLIFVIIICGYCFAKSIPQESICRTEACQKSAENMKACMNQSVNPCDNFYQFACGNYKNRPDNKNRGSNFFLEIRNQLHERVEHILLNSVHKDDPEAMVKAKQLYKLCTDTDNMNAKGVAPLGEILQKIGITRSPLTKMSKNFEWEKAAAKMQRILNINFLISVDVVPDPANRTVNRISISKPSEFYPYGNDYTQNLQQMKNRDQQLTNMKQLSDDDSASSDDLEALLAALSLKRKFMDFIIGIDSDLNRNKNNKKKSRNQLKTLKSKTEWLTNFIIQRISLHYKIHPNEFPFPVPMTLKQLQEFTDSKLDGCDGKSVIDWEQYLNTYFENTNVTINFNDSTTKIFVYDQEYLSELFPFIKDNHKTLEVALWWDIVSTLSIFTTNKLRNRKIEFEAELVSSQNATTYMDNVCMGVVQKYFGYAIVYGFLKDEKGDTNRSSVQDMLNYIKLAFEKIIERTEWMDGETKAAAINKINEMRRFISKPPWLNNATALDEYFDDVKIFKKDFLKTIFTVEQDAVEETINQLYEINDIKNDYNTTNIYVYPLDVNAFYASQYNIMIIPMGIINFPFYTHPIEALNYGALGTIIGHEITHGFDTTGRRYGADGNLKRWWKNETLTEYKKRTSCFIDSYNQIEIGDETVDGLQTIDENIADNGGLRQALIAYRRFVEVNGTELRLEGFENYTHEQLLILSFANIWCENSAEVSPIDEHSPAEARVIGVLKNSKEFEEIWQCEKGKPMNPKEDKCRIW